MRLCEWNPLKNEPAIESQGPARAEDGCLNEATLAVGFRGDWHLCASCAALPVFLKYRRRVPLGAGSRPEVRV